MAIQLGRWDCTSCGQVGNLGPETSCKSCGSPRSKEAKFYLPEDSVDLTDENVIKEAESGQDWLCDYCGSDNKSAENVCKSCGNEKTQDDTIRQEKEYSLDEVPRNGFKKTPLQSANIQKKQTGKKSSFFKNILIFLGILLLVFTFLLWPRSSKVEVTKHYWERYVEIENNRLVTEEDWSLPSTSIRVISSFNAIHHYDKVLDHYQTRERNVRVKTGTEKYKCGKKDMGNGYFKDKYCSRDVYDNRRESYQDPVYKNVPVYKTKYRYEIYRWIMEHILNSKGNDKNPQWPSENLKDNNWREGKKTEKYVLYFKDKKGKEYNETVDFNFWNKVNDSQMIDAKKNSLGSFYGLEKN